MCRRVVITMQNFSCIIKNVQVYILKASSFKILKHDCRSTQNGDNINYFDKFKDLEGAMKTV